MYIKGDYVRPNYPIEAYFTTINSIGFVDVYIKTIHPSDIFRVYDCEWSNAHDMYHITLNTLDSSITNEIIYIEGNSKDFKLIKKQSTIEMLDILYGK